MSRPLLELADIIRTAGQRLIDRRPAWLTWLHDRAVPHRRDLRRRAMQTLSRDKVTVRLRLWSGWPRRCMLALRPSRHLLQFLSQSALPQVSKPGTRPLAGSAPLGIATDTLCPRGLPAPRTGADRSPKQGSDLRAAVPLQRRDSNPNCRLPQPPPLPNRLLHVSPH